LKLHAEDSTQQIVRWTRTGVGAGSLDVDTGGNAVLNAHTTSAAIAFHLQASEKARITADGKLGLGTSSPVSNIEAYANYDATGANANTNILTLTAFDNTGGYYYSNNGAGIAFRSGQVTRAPQVMGAIYGANTSDQSTANGQLTFHTRSSDTVAERVRIDSSGNVGIGTQSPANPLHVVTSNNNPVFLESTTPNCNVVFNDDTTTANVTVGCTGNDFRIQAGNSERLRIKSDGKLGLGTSTPFRTLHVAGAGDTGLMLQTTNAVNDKEIWEIQVAGDASNHANLVFRSRTNAGTGGTEALRIKNDGNVGIGTASPLSILHVKTGTNENIRLNSSALSAGGPQIGAVNDASNAYVNLTLNGNSILFGNGSEERARIDSLGRLLVGTGSTTADSTAIFQGYSAATTGPSWLYLQRGQAAGSISSGNSLGILSFADNAANVFGEIKCQTDGSAGVGDYPGRLVFSTTADGASSPTTRMTIKNDGKVGIGTESPGAKCDIAGGSDASLRIYNTQNNSPSANHLELLNNSSDGLKFSVGRSGAGGNSNLTYDNTFNINAGTTGAVTFDSSGRLLVGTSSSVTTYKTEIVDDTSLNLALVTGNSGSPANCPFLTLRRSRGSTASPSVVSPGDLTGVIDFRGYSGAASSYVTCAQISATVDGTPDSGGDATDMPGRLVFSTTADGASSPTERMRISSNGDVNVVGTFYAKYNAVFTWNTSAGIKAVGDGNTNTGGVGIETTTASTATRYHVSISNPNGVVGSISTNGSATAFNTSSDYRLKENIVPLTGAADRVNQLQVHRFNFIADPDTTVDGFIAHEAQAVVPECVTGTKDEVDDEGNPVYQGIDQSKLVPLLTAALQEALAKIETLEQRLTDAGIA
jgi:hypothetical protein